jgi:hypothetical protein
MEREENRYSEGKINVKVYRERKVTERKINVKK